MKGVSDSDWGEIPAKDIHRFDDYSILKRKDGIIQVQFRAGFTIGVEDARKIMGLVERLKGEEKCLLMVVFEEDNTFSLETREYISSDRISGMIRADALVIKGLALEILGQGYIRINKPKRPTRLFKSVDVAAMWLLNHNGLASA